MGAVQKNQTTSSAPTIERRSLRSDDNDEHADPEPDRLINAATNQSPPPPTNIHTNAEQLKKGGVYPQKQKT
jgi:hypothetical protein